MVINIIITGINGFVGTNFSTSLSCESCITGIDLSRERLPENILFYNWDELIEVPTSYAIIHLAGKAHYVHNTDDIKEYFDVNVGLTKEIFNFFLESEAEKFIFFSSVKAVADSVNGNILTEDHFPDPQTPYGQSKLAAEQYILEQKLPREKKVYILRPCMIHGPGNKGNLNLLYNFVKKGIPYPLGAFNNLRSFTSIENLIFIIREILEKDIEPGIYHVADDEPVSTNEIVKLISGSLNRKPHIWDVPKSVVNKIAKAGDLMRLPLNSERLKKLTESYVVSNSKLKSALGIDKMPVTATDGLKHTFSSFT